MATPVRPLIRPRSRRAAEQAPATVKAAVAGPATAADAAATPALDVNRVGVVFVHGIGTQPACETFLSWSGSIVSVLADWRRDHRDETHDFGPDPVLRCEYDLAGASLPILELDVPEWDGHPAQRWVLTEAWWAATTRSPGLGSMTTYARRALPRIIGGIRQSYATRAAAWAQQRQEARAVASGSDGGTYDHRQLVLGAVPRRFDWIDALDRIQKELTILAFGPAIVLGTVALWVYAPFRAIPIQPLQDLAALKYADNALTRSFGELPDIINDPIQSANVRARLIAAIKGLRAEGCGRIVVIGHSGGAIISFATLCDQAFTDIQVDKLVTLGEGLALAWRIENAPKGLEPGSRLLGDLSQLRPNLRWADYWSTYDPAPAGPLQPPPGACLADRSYSTVNRMSILEDHGSYWDNDEEFLIPLVQHIDTPTGEPEDSRFFRDTTLGTVRLAWRRRRVAVLALWRWIATLGAAVPIAVTTIAALLGAAGVASLARAAGPARLGANFAGWWATVPGHEIIAGPLDGVSKVASWPDALRSIGEWFVGTAIIVVVFLLLARIGTGRWEAWDLSERAAARRRVPEQAGVGRPALTFLVLTAVVAATSAAFLAYLWR